MRIRTSAPNYCAFGSLMVGDGDGAACQLSVRAVHHLIVSTHLSSSHLISLATQCQRHSINDLFSVESTVFIFTNDFILIIRRSHNYDLIKNECAHAFGRLSTATTTAHQLNATTFSAAREPCSRRAIKFFVPFLGAWRKINAVPAPLPVTFRPSCAIAFSVFAYNS